MNIKLLRRVQKRILKEPEHFDIYRYFKQRFDNKFQTCKTTACIGGWAIALSKKKSIKTLFDKYRETSYPYSIARELLKLNIVQADILFVLNHWPESFNTDYHLAYHAKDWKLIAKITSDRIDHFIATEGRE